MNKERIDRMMNEILSVSKSLDSSLGKVEDKLVEDVGKDLKNTIKILEVLEKFNHLRMENIMTINNASRARKLIKVVEGEEGQSATLDKIVDYWREELTRLVQTQGTDYYQPDVNPEEYAKTTVDKMLPKLKSGGYKGALSRNPALKKAAMRAGVKTSREWDALFVAGGV